MDRPWGRSGVAPRAGDALLAALVAAVSLGGLYAVNGWPTGGRGWLGYGLVGAGAAALAARRRHPRAVLATVAGLGAAVFALGVEHDGPFVMLPALVALYTAAARAGRWWAVAAAAGLLGVIGLAGLAGGTAFDAIVLLWAAGWMVAAIVAGEVARSRRSYLAAVEARAVEAERSREEEARRRAGEERLRIARELHDVLAHHLSIINVQAGVAAHLDAEPSSQTRQALVAIKQASKAALAELRATLGVLREVDEAAPRAPAPGLARVDDLVAGASAAGLTVDVQVTGRPRALPEATDLAAFRIVQEALTNVMRHAGASAVALRIAYGDALVVEIDDDGRGPGDGTPAAPGAGMLGMRERAEAVGGSFESGAGPTGGFRVRAVLPLDGRA